MRAAQPITGPIANHAEGPFWDAVGQRLLFVDMLAGALVELDAAGHPTRHEVGTVAAAVRARSTGGFVIALEHGVALLDSALAVVEVLPPLLHDPLIRMNDGGCDPQGRFYCGTMAYAETQGAGTLFRLDPDRSTHRVLEGVTISNGLQWSADGTRVFYNDTPSGSIDVFDFDAASGAFSNRRPFAVIDPQDGYPDGMAIDSEDGVWVAVWGGGQVRRYDPAGTLTEVVTVPASQSTACTFGGADLSTLYITTSRLRLPEDAQPEAGSIFAIDVSVAGAVPHSYAG
jgi:sugar lactone lactonase YvrE